MRWGVLAAVLLVAACARYPAVSYRDSGVYGRNGHPPAQPAPRDYVTRGRYQAPTMSRQTAAAPSAPSADIRAWPSDGRHRVRTGDSAYGIAREYGVAFDDFARLNNLSPPYDLAPGQTLALPRPPGHVVSRGDTIYGLSKRYGVPMAALVRLNSLSPPYRLAVGQALLIPKIETAPEPKTVVAALPTSEAQAKMPAPAPESARPVARPVPVSLPPTPPRAGPDFLWPLRGPILIAFGDRGKGLFNDGINIAASKGAPVRAAENGVVVYAGNELRGFGNMILLKHDGGWTTAYAHASRLLVGHGDRVRRGQVIARVGSTGSVTRPQLHFELRRGDGAVDPQKYLSTQVAGGDASTRVAGGDVTPASGPAGRRGPG